MSQTTRKGAKQFTPFCASCGHSFAIPNITVCRTPYMHEGVEIDGPAVSDSPLARAITAALEDEGYRNLSDAAAVTRAVEIAELIEKQEQGR